MVTPPAVSAKIPSVRASRRIPSRTSSSVTDAHDPPDLRMTSSAYQPSAGLPMASDLAMVDGFTGRMASVPSAKAVATGEHPSAGAHDGNSRNSAPGWGRMHGNCGRAGPGPGLVTPVTGFVDL